MPNQDSAPSASRGWLATVAATAVGAALVLYGLGQPFDSEQGPLRILWAQRPLADILFDPMMDPRLPQLVYVALHLLTRAFGTGEAASVAFFALCGVLSIAVVHRMALEVGDPPTAFATALSVAVNATFLRQARDVAWAAPFLLFSSVSLWSWIRLLSGGGRRAGVVLVLSTALAAHTALHGGLVLAVEAAALGWLAFERRTPVKRPLLWLGLAAAACAPALWHALNAIALDVHPRRVASLHPELFYGDVDLPGFAAMVKDVLLSSRGAPFTGAAALLGAGAAARHADPARRAWLLWALLPCALVPPLLGAVCVQPYYFLFMAPPAAFLVFSGVASAVDLLRPLTTSRCLPWFKGLLSSALVAAYALDTWRDRSRIWDPAGDMPAVVQAMGARPGCRVVVFEPRYLDVLFLYYSFHESPRFARYAGACVYTEECSAPPWRLVNLADQGDLPPDWEARSARRLRELQAETDFWYVDFERFSNRAFHRDFGGRCSLEADPAGPASSFRLFYCPRGKGK